MFLLSLAYAHLPHQQVPGLAVDPDFGSTGRARAPLVFSSNTDHRYPMVLATEDGGATWALVPGPQETGRIADATWFGGGALLLGEDGRLWSEAEGWRSVEVATAAREVHAWSGGLAVVADDELYVAPALDGPWTASGLGVPLRAAPGPGGIAVLTADGEVYTSPDGAAWTWAAGGFLDARAIAWGDDIYVSESSAVHAVGAGDPCGDVETEYGGFYQLHVTGDGRLWLGTDVSLWVSADRCATFTEEAVATATPDYGAEDTVIQPEYAWTDVVLAGDTLLVAGYTGLSLQAGADDPVLVRLQSPRLHRALGFGVLDDGTVRLWATSYGGGLLWSDDGGARWEAGSTGMVVPAAFGRELEVWGDVLLYSGDESSMRSVDGGATWGEISLKGPEAVFVNLVGLGERAYAIIAGSVTTIALSDDGETWTVPPLDTNFLPYAGECLEAGVFEGAPALFASGGREDGLMVSVSDPLEWVLLGPASLCHVLSWPPGEGTRTLALDDDGGIHVYEAGVWTTPSAAPPPVAAWGLLPDGQVLALDGTGLAWRSADGGQTFAPTGGAVPYVPEAVLATPESAPVDAVVVSTRRGLYASVDLGASFAPLTTHERFESFAGWLWCQSSAGETCRSVSGEAFGAGVALGLQPGDLLRIPTDQPWFRPIVDAAVEARVDGGAATALSPGDALYVGPGQHTIELTALSPLVQLDAVVLEGEEGGIPGWPAGEETGETGDTGGPDETGDTEDSGDSADSADTTESAGETDDASVEVWEKDKPCGCGGGAAVVPWWAALILLARRRRA